MGKILFFCAILTLLAAFLGESLDRRAGPKLPDRPPERIVSLAPGITETLYALGLGDLVVGNTLYCNWPPAAAKKPRVAGFREINLEALARTRPDLAILPDDMAHFARQIQNLGIEVLTFEGRSLKGYLRDLQKLASRCGAQEAAEKLAREFQVGATAGQPQAGQKRPTILFAIMTPEECARPVTEIDVIGRDGFYNELIEAAGGTNAYTGALAYPRIAREAMLSMNPDIIVVAATGCGNPEAARKNWQKIGRRAAIESNSVAIFTEPGDTIPGPRSLMTLNKLAQLTKAYRQASGATQ